ncbi:hypothetical protein IJH23_01720 [Candidatus Saccharibacteria bacterium]|nr:hypothetical protein [Candidatus Saccharibacteria bacterium]
MSKLTSLLNATMSGGIQIFNYRGKTKRSRWLMPTLLAVLMGVLILISAVGMTAELKEAGGESAILSIYALVTTIIIVTEGIYKSGDLLFKPRDNDMLLAMPIKKPLIVFARMVKFYAFEMLYCLIFLLPALIAYAMNVEVGASYFLIAITMMLLIPVIPIAVSCVIGFITSAISSRFKHKAVLEVLLSFGFLVICAILILNVNSASDFDGRSAVTIGNRITEFYYPAAALVRLATDFEIGQYLLFVAINLGVVAVAVFLVSRFYFKIVTRLNVIRKNGNVDAKYSFRKRSQTLAMVRKELTRYFKTPVWLTNTAIGLVIFVVAVGAVCFKFDDLVNSLADSVEEFPLTVDEIRAFVPSITVAMVAFTSLLTFITAPMISLEGKAFNMLKSLPISGVKIIMTKVLSAMILIVPVTAVGSLLMFIKFQFSILDLVLVLLAVAFMPLVTELVGILVDLKYARFDAESDAVTVRQSASVMVATFMGLGMVLLTVSLIFGLVFLAGQTAGLLMVDAVFVIVALFLYFTIVARGDEKIVKLVA